MRDIPERLARDYRAPSRIPSFCKARIMIPRMPVMDDYYVPVDIGGRIANYPIVDHTVPQGADHEVLVDWHTTIARFENVCWPQFFGDVWSVQLTARPGYYVTPENLYAYGLDDATHPPLG